MNRRALDPGVAERVLAPKQAGRTGPGERRYHPGYYAAFLLDPDGNNIEAVSNGAVASGGGKAPSAA